MTDCPSSADDSRVPEPPASSDDLTTSDAALVDGSTMPSDLGEATERVGAQDDVSTPRGLTEAPCASEVPGVNEIKSSEADLTDGMTMPDATSEDVPSMPDAVDVGWYHCARRAARPAFLLVALCAQGRSRCCVALPVQPRCRMGAWLVRGRGLGSMQCAARCWYHVPCGGEKDNQPGCAPCRRNVGPY